MKKIFLALLIHAAIAAAAQKQVCIAFYNQENLFDTIDDPLKNDNEFLPSHKTAWNTEKYSNKLNHMARVISSMNNGEAPDLLGMCEVENAAVLRDLAADKQLAGQKYNIVHFESPDDRSIDNALLYKSKQFTLVKSAAYAVTMPDNPQFKTRDILLAKLRAKNKTEIIILVNHFPSRLGGQKESDAKRFLAAAVLKHIFDSIRNADPSQSVIAMGDFNDEPTDSSILSVLHAGDDPGADLYNAMLPLKKQGLGSHYYRKEWSMLDQLIMNKNVSSCTGKVCFVKGSATIYKQDWMLETDEKYKGAPLRTFAGGKYLNGYSDHLPVYLYVEMGK